MITVQPKTAAARPVAPGAALDIVTRMAFTMRELALAGVTVDEEALANAGYSIAEIEKHKGAARDRANQQSIRRVA